MNINIEDIDELQANNKAYLKNFNFFNNESVSTTPGSQAPPFVPPVSNQAQSVEALASSKPPLKPNTVNRRRRFLPWSFSSSSSLRLRSTTVLSFSPYSRTTTDFISLPRPKRERYMGSGEYWTVRIHNQTPPSSPKTPN
ncbi:hypothetical protein PIB30_061453 [Stylosanthes scabra]|uniref:Uncharacterized protein n=1 Tax=Stylosanthes scabra TaxID=79078 RepID=A0ABU6SM71_9FABA|nr:hypothetical protein [Stylosanthes scabra]